MKTMFSSIEMAQFGRITVQNIERVRAESSHLWWGRFRSFSPDPARSIFHLGMRGEQPQRQPRTRQQGSHTIECFGAGDDASENMVETLGERRAPESNPRERGMAEKDEVHLVRCPDECAEETNFGKRLKHVSEPGKCLWTPAAQRVVRQSAELLQPGRTAGQGRG